MISFLVLFVLFLVNLSGVFGSDSCNAESQAFGTCFQGCVLECALSGAGIAPPADLTCPAQEGFFCDLQSCCTPCPTEIQAFRDCIWGQAGITCSTDCAVSAPVNPPGSVPSSPTSGPGPCDDPLLALVGCFLTNTECINCDTNPPSDSVNTCDELDVACQSAIGQCCASCTTEASTVCGCFADQCRSGSFSPVPPISPMPFIGPPFTGTPVASPPIDMVPSSPTVSPVTVPPASGNPITFVPVTAIPVSGNPVSDSPVMASPSPTPASEACIAMQNFVVACFVVLLAVVG